MSRSRLVKVDFAFSAIKSKVQVSLPFWRVAHIFLLSVIYGNVDFVFIVPWKVIHFGLNKHSFYSTTNNKLMVQSARRHNQTLLLEMLTEITFSQANFWLIFFSFLWHKIFTFIHIFEGWPFKIRRNTWGHFRFLSIRIQVWSVFHHYYILYRWSKVYEVFSFKWFIWFYFQNKHVCSIKDS